MDGGQHGKARKGLGMLDIISDAENGLNGWLHYAPLSAIDYQNVDLPLTIVALNTTPSSPKYVAGLELQKGFQGIFNKTISISYQDTQTLVINGISSNSIYAAGSASKEGFQDVLQRMSPIDYQRSNSLSYVLVGTVSEFIEIAGNDSQIPDLLEDGFWLNIQGSVVEILGQNEQGTLYGVFEYLSMLAQGNFSNVSYATNPIAPIRWVNQWDNLDGSIERGFGGNSIFFANGTVVDDLTRVTKYARLLASIRLNAVVVNNVNANSSILSSQNLRDLGRIADVFRPYGIRLAVALDFASPQEFGGLSTYDPLDPSVIAWWKSITDQIYQHVPDMAGYLVKADSEGKPGPLVYNRTLAQGANLFAHALQPYGGIVMFRAFVYNQLNESDWKSDRANAAVQFFTDLDGQFEENVVVQIKYGPIDFQVREPVSPLFANLFHTNVAVEFQITQEYLGQQCHLAYLPPLWRTILDFDLRVDNRSSLVRDIVSGQNSNRPLGGLAGVVNVGTNDTWLGSHLAMSNLYAYGRLAWDTTVDPQAILQDWIRLTFGLDTTVLNIITQMSMESWPAYENYTGNLGVQTLTDILYTHFGPNPASQDDNGWGQWTRADHTTVGMDRTVRNGTGYSAQYPPEIFEMYENLETTPDDLLLWFHHVNYTHRLHSGETVIQHFYNAHYEGAATAQKFVTTWESLNGKIDDERYDEVLYRLVYQAGHSLVWRDAINDFYFNLSGIPDESNRVGNHPWRVEGESMTLDGFRIYIVKPFETASNSTAVVTTSNTTVGTAIAQVKFPSGVYDVAVNYYDLWGGQSRWQIYLNDVMFGEWMGNTQDGLPGYITLGHTPSIYLDGHSAMRITFRNITVETGDMLKIVGIPDGVEPAPFDYVSFLPPGTID